MSPLQAASRAGDTVLVKKLLDDGAPVDEEDEHGITALIYASEYRHTEVAKLLLDTMLNRLLEKGASPDEKDKDGQTLLMQASKCGYTELVKQLLDKGAPVDEKDRWGSTALMWASIKGYTEVVQLLLDKGASLDENDEGGGTALMKASSEGRTEVVKLLLDKGASLDEKNKGGRTALVLASLRGQTEVVQLLLNTMVKRLLEKGASLDEKDVNGTTMLMQASKCGYTEMVKLLLDQGARVDAKDKDGHTALPGLVEVDEDQLGRMAAAQVHRHLLEGQRSDAPVKEAEEEEVALARPRQKVVAEATATAVLKLVRAAGLARARARTLRSSDPRSADDHQVLFARLQLAAAACVQNDELGEVRKDGGSAGAYERGPVQQLFDSDDGRKALELAVKIEAKELLAQPVVQKYIKVAWGGGWEDLGDHRLGMWIILFIFLLLQLLFLLPLVALVPALEPWLTGKLGKMYLLDLPVVKFGLACAADLTLALALTFIPAADLATAPVAPLLLVWVGSGLLWEARELMAPSSSDAESCMTRGYDRLAAYWGDSINRVDATALIFSLAALVAFVSTGDSEDAWATSLRAVAVFLLWLRVIRVLLVSPQFGPFVLMFFRMLFGDVLYFLVLLIFLLVAFAASWTVLLEPQSSLIAGCADDLGGVDIGSTLLRLLEGALTGNDFFECARNSTNSPVAAWVITAMYVTLTAVLLLNMLIAMMAKTFDNISEASGTNYLFLFAQRTLAHQNERPTPPPLNVVGLPCEAICRLWAWLYPNKTSGTVVGETVAAETVAAVTAANNPIEPSPPSSPASLPEMSLSEKAKEELTAAANVAADKARLGSLNEVSLQVEETPVIEVTAVLKASVAVEAVGEAAVKAAAALAEKITEYIIDHQDDAAQEDRWRTIMKRDMTKSFKKVEAGVQEVKAEVKAEVQKVKEEVEAGVQKVKAEVKAEVEKVKEEVQAMQLEMRSKMDETLQLVKSLAKERS